MANTASKTKPVAPNHHGHRHDAFRLALLQWYDRHQRTLPWRSLNHDNNPHRAYHVWLSEVMLQQTTVPAVMPYFVKFIERWPSIHDLAAAPQDAIMEAWAGLGYYSRARNLHQCAIRVANDHDGQFPPDQDALKKLPGIGEYTSAAISSIAFNRPAIVIDGNVDRIIVRLHAITRPIRESKPQIRALAADYFITDKDDGRAGDFAQAMMDLGATICTPQNPKCGLCPVMDFCAAKADGIAGAIPAKPPKTIKPLRHGIAYWIEDGQGGVLLERRPKTGMLAETLGLPCSPWVEVERKTAKPLSDSPHIRHVFTHFELHLRIEKQKTQEFDLSQIGNGQFFYAQKSQIQTMGFPSLFQKAIDFAIREEITS